jgi:hypothetical protein
MMELNSKENCIISKVVIVKITDLPKHNIKDHGQGEGHSMSTCCELHRAFHNVLCDYKHL